MTTGPKPPAEVTIEPSLVRGLLQEQHSDLAQLALIEIGEGWGNKLFAWATIVPCAFLGVPLRQP
jgi:hypothetical protein